MRIRVKQNYAGNFFRIQEIERTLTALSEQKLRVELENYKIFDRLNNEKITPYFMKLAKVHNAAPDIGKIRGTNGEILNETELGKHVTDTYSDLYDIPRDSRDTVQEYLTNFLGPVKDSEPVINAKLNEREKDDLDRPLLINELDTAIKQCNKKSAPGTDGISNKFICHFGTTLERLC